MNNSHKSYFPHIRILNEIRKNKIRSHKVGSGTPLKVVGVESSTEG